MNKVLVVTTFNNHFHFFRKLSDTLTKRDFKFVFVTNKYSIVKEALKYNLEISPIKRKSGNVLLKNVDDTFEVAAGSLSEDNAKTIYNSVWDSVNRLNEIYEFDYIFVWGGVRLIEKAAGDFAKKNKIKSLFFELGNFPNKIFVDPKGTNARSLLAKNVNVLDGFYYNEEKYENWRNYYIETGLNHHAVPQGSKVAEIDYKKNLLDEFGFKVLNYAQNEPLLTYEKFAGKFLRRLSELEFDEVSLNNDKYIFYPMQVNKDAQLILNSNVKNLDALKIGTNLAQEMNAQFFVKPHPAEVEYAFIKKINSKKSELGYKFVQNNTLELIKNAELVLTINSTVGLQAKILDKNIKCLGKAFYSDFDKIKLMQYLQSYLLDADFWSDSSISSDTADKIISRADLTIN